MSSVDSEPFGNSIRTRNAVASFRKRRFDELAYLWKTADPDIPIYREAKAEYAALLPLHAMH